MDNETLIKEVESRFSYSPETGAVTRKKAWGKFPAGSAISTMRSDGYISGSIGSRRITAHRIAWVLTYGEVPEVIDHINGVRDDNRICNLRNTSQRVNTQNQRGAKSNNSTHALGVSYSKQAKRYRAQIVVGRKFIHLGYFDTPEEAHAAYLQAKRRLHEGCTI